MTEQSAEQSLGSAFALRTNPMNKNPVTKETILQMTKRFPQNAMPSYFCRCTRKRLFTFYSKQLFKIGTKRMDKWKTICIEKQAVNTAGGYKIMKR